MMTVEELIKTGASGRTAHIKLNDEYQLLVTQNFRGYFGQKVTLVLTAKDGRTVGFSSFSNADEIRRAGAKVDSVLGESPSTSLKDAVRQIGFGLIDRYNADIKRQAEEEVELEELFT